MESVVNALRRLEPDLVRYAARLPQGTSLACGRGRNDGTDPVLALRGSDGGQSLMIWLPLATLFSVCFEYPVETSALGLDDATLLNLAHEARPQLAESLARWLPFAKEVPWMPTGLAPAEEMHAHPAVLTPDGLIYWCRDNASFRERISWRNTHLVDVRLPTTLIFGTTWLTRQELTRLQVGDLLLGQWETALVVQGERRFGFSMEGKMMVLNEELEAQVHVDHEMVDADTAGRAPRDGELINAGFDDLTISVRFVMRGRDMTIAELAELQAGSVLPIGAASELHVNVMTRHGELLGVGELVAVGEQVGVQLSRVGSVSFARPRRSGPTED